MINCVSILCLRVIRLTRILPTLPLTLIFNLNCRFALFGWVTPYCTASAFFIAQKRRKEKKQKKSWIRWERKHGFKSLEIHYMYSMPPPLFKTAKYQQKPKSLARAAALLLFLPFVQKLYCVNHYVFTRKCHRAIKFMWAWVNSHNIVYPHSMCLQVLQIHI